MDFSPLARLRLRWRRLHSPLPPSVVSTRWLDRLFQLGEVMSIFDAYEKVSNSLCSGVRPLNPEEVDLLYPVFGESIPYHRIRLHERAHIGPRRHGIAYVSFFTINSWGKLSPPVLVHEVMHVWQYVHRGALYIPRALAAQRTFSGYNYGGLPGLRRATGLDSFNYEQMAAVIEDGYRLANGYPLRFLHEAGTEAENYYNRFNAELRQV
ncbi:MAG: hypothetical protein WA952_06120 [Lewinella sp.]